MRYYAAALLAVVVLTWGLVRPAGGQLAAPKQLAMPALGGFGGGMPMAVPVAQPPTAAAADFDPVLTDELPLKGTGRGVDGPALLDFVRLRLPPRGAAGRLAR